MSDDSHHVIAPKTYYIVFVVLLVLLVFTVLAAQIDHGLVNIVVAITIATTKAVLIVLYFMHVRYNAPLLRVIAVAGFVWFIILLTLTLSDYTTRGWGREGETAAGIAAAAR